ncbi:MAG: amino acid adenylation domain-containing protein [Variovorax sp.]
MNDPYPNRDTAQSASSPTQVAAGARFATVPRQTVHALVEAQATRTPDVVAVSHGDASLTYRELDARANRWADMLCARGVGPDTPVAIYLERGLDMVAALLAVLKAGGAYVPLDPSHPPDRTAVILQGAAPRVVLTQTSLASALPALQAEPILLDKVDSSDGIASTGRDRATTTASLTPRNLAYVIYTSGSTGTPKGVAMHHEALVNLLHWQRLNPARGHGQRTLQFAALGFDVAFQEIFATLSTGGTLVLVDESVRRDPRALVALMRAQRVQRLFLPFIALQNLAEYLGAADETLPDLQDVMTAGEQLHASPAVRRMFQRLPGCRLHNQYGPTESHVVTALQLADDPASWAALPSIGRPIANNRIHVLDTNGCETPIGVAGEIHIGGVGVARGYLHRPELTAERFIPDPFGSDPDARLYKTGDIGRWREDGEIDYIGRNDNQVKVRGFRVELGEIESALLAHADVREAAVLAPRDSAGDARLVAYVTTVSRSQDTGALRSHLERTLPSYMVPGTFVHLEAMPVSPNGKVDRRALPEPAARRPEEMPQPYAEGRTALEQQVCAAFAAVLGIDRVGRADNFFDLGGDSVRVLKVVARLQAETAQRMSTNVFFQNPTPEAIAREMEGGAPVAEPKAPVPVAVYGIGQEPIAIIAMAGRFPGAADVEQFWANLCEGRDSISFFDDATLDAGVEAALRDDPSYVRARGVIGGVEDFDPAFFGINPKEAMLMDPQQRIFLEICWECMERGGYAPDRQQRPVGVYAGMHNATYFQKHVLSRPDLIDAVGEFTVMLGNEKDYVATRVANRLNLTGPAISMNTACSTSLVAMAQAFHALRSGQCDMALAGGISITCPPRSGYVHQEGAMLSPDGRTRSFDAQAQGTVFSDGAGVVLLKRLSDAQADGDTVYAVLRGVAVNNDGGAKASFTAPSVDGQAAVVSAALASAGVDARSISYVEAHGTATPMGDPVEVAALARSYGRHTGDLDFCGIGSVKSNVGHLLMAAGAAGVIKTALALHEERLPASLHYDAANPAIDFAHTPFHVNDRLTDWTRRDGVPRRAGVSSFGVGGTNAHVILEEAPARAASEPAHGPQLLTLSARTPTALAASMSRLADHLEAHPDASLADVAWTLRVGRKHFAHRGGVVADSVAAAILALRGDDSMRRTVAEAPAWAAQPVFLFPGQGAQYAGMGRHLYAREPVFRAAFDECLEALGDTVPFDLRERMFSDDEAALRPTSLTQPATFVLEYALARQMQSLGVRPEALIGHSVGEFVAAVLAGVMQLPDAIRLVAQRGALMQALPAGSMLSVRMPAATLLARLPAALSLAADNGPNACVAAGPSDEVETFRQQLESEGIAARVLQTSHAFHSAMMVDAVAPFETLVRRVPLAPPTLPIFSTLTGRLLTAAEALDPSYWARHLREPVRFSPALRSALDALAHPVFIELGPRNTLATLARQHARKDVPTPAVSVLEDQPAQESAALCLAVGRLWTLGLDIEPDALDRRAIRHRVRLPTYPFERKRYWIDIAASTPKATAAAPAPALEVETPSAAAREPVASHDRRAALHLQLRELFERISGSELAAVDGTTPFIELGLDSLTLTQAASQVKKHFKVNIGFRQLMESHRSFDALAAFIDVSQPSAGQAVASAPAIPVVPRPIPHRSAPTTRFDAAHPPVPHARLGRDRDGQPAWFVPDPAARGKFMKIHP